MHGRDLFLIPLFLAHMSLLAHYMEVQSQRQNVMEGLAWGQEQMACLALLDLNKS